MKTIERGDRYWKTFQIWEVPLRVRSFGSFWSSVSPPSLYIYPTYCPISKLSAVPDRKGIRLFSVLGRNFIGKTSVAQITGREGGRQQMNFPIMSDIPNFILITGYEEIFRCLTTLRPGLLFCSNRSQLPGMNYVI